MLFFSNRVVYYIFSRNLDFSRHAAHHARALGQWFMLNSLDVHEKKLRLLDPQVSLACAMCADSAALGHDMFPWSRYRSI
jgi:hypothetical protein